MTSYAPIWVHMHTFNGHFDPLEVKIHYFQISSMVFALIWAQVVHQLHHNVSHYDLHFVQNFHLDNFVITMIFIKK